MPFYSSFDSSCCGESNDVRLQARAASVKSSERGTNVLLSTWPNLGTIGLGLLLRVLKISSFETCISSTALILHAQLLIASTLCKPTTLNRLLLSLCAQSQLQAPHQHLQPPNFVSDQPSPTTNFDQPTLNSSDTRDNRQPIAHSEVRQPSQFIK